MKSKLTLVAMCLFVAIIVFISDREVTICEQEVTVLEITRTDYRTIYVMTEAGEIALYTPHNMHVGKKICIKSHREWNWK